MIYPFIVKHLPNSVFYKSDCIIEYFVGDSIICNEKICIHPYFYFNVTMCSMTLHYSLGYSQPVITKYFTCIY